MYSIRPEPRSRIRSATFAMSSPVLFTTLRLLSHWEERKSTVEATTADPGAGVREDWALVGATAPAARKTANAERTGADMR
jgi:hypothetical protein